VTLWQTKRFAGQNGVNVIDMTQTITELSPIKVGDVLYREVYRRNQERTIETVKVGQFCEPRK
jgi:hypothetical protein